MSRYPALSDWLGELSNRLPQLSKPQVTVLAMWSYAIAVTRTCGRHTVALFLGLLMRQKAGTVQQRLREWCYDEEDKQGSHRQQLQVECCFAPLLRWVVSLWQGTALALVLDATTLGDRLVVLSISVVYRGCGLPVAWTVLPAQQKGAWRGHWLNLLGHLHPALPSEWRVLVLADRGLYARWLYRAIVRLGWHPFLRIQQASKFRPLGQRHWYWLHELLGAMGTSWSGSGTAFSGKDRHQLCTLVAWWGEGHPQAWFIITDLPSSGCQAAWYGLRAWCEQGFKCLKRGGWQWQNTRMTDPHRASRMWLALAVALLWMVSLGSDLELAPSSEPPELAELPDLRPILELAAIAVRTRRSRLFRLGWLWLLVQSVMAQPLPLPRRLVPEPWITEPARMSSQHPKTYP